MKSICYILIFILIVLFLWNINNKESFTCNISMGQYAQCFERHQGRNEKNLSRMDGKDSQMKAKLDGLVKSIDDLGKKQAKTRKTLDGIVGASKGKGNENTDHCKKFPDAC